MQLSCENKMSVRLFLSILFASLCCESNGYQRFQEQIPNGDKVPNPCNRSTIWPGVGHQSTYGLGPRNPFGLDFYANSMVWNWTLCKKDSDGDGLTNGQELGDPNCVWKVGSIPEFSTNLSHPGICEPLGSSRCSGKNSWLMNCSPGKLNCPAVDEPDVQNYTMRFPVSPVPTKETTYICHRFTLPNDSVYDIIAFEPVVDKAQILHHMSIYACPNEPQDHPANESFECDMGGGPFCMSMIGIWGVGSPGQCLNSQLGFRMGPGGFKYALIQLHWNNPEHIMNLTDSSGMRIYYTAKLRPNRGEIAMMGQEYLEIPPGQKEMTLTGTCTSLCTKKLPQSFFLTSTFIHMHKTGKSGDIRLNRNGTLLRILDNITDYDFNTPKLIEYENPIEVKPGDEIQVKCVYQTTQRNSTTYFGDATTDEMCYGFFVYYPLLEGVENCGQWKSISYCNRNGDIQLETCDLSTFIKLLGLLQYTCTENCTSTPCAVIMDGMYATGCHYYPDVKSYIATFISNYSRIFEKCALERPSKPTSTSQRPVSLVSIYSSDQGTSRVDRISNPPSTSQRPDSLDPIHSSGQGISIGFGFVVLLMAYAAYY